MTKAVIAFRSNPGQYEFIGTAELKNAYAEQMGEDAKNVLAVLPSEGTVEFANTTAGPCRGLIYLPDLDTIYSVHPSTIYKINSAGTATLVGAMIGTDMVQLSRNQKSTPQIIINGTFGTRVVENDTVFIIPDADFPSSAVTVDVSNDYAIAGNSDRSFYVSDINQALSWPGDFDIFDQQAGKLVRIQEDNGDIIGFCVNHTEWWRHTGNADFPFERLTARSRGLLARNAIAKSAGTRMYVGDDNVVYRLNAYDSLPISTHEISRLIEADASPSTIFAFSYDRQGHQVCCFTGSNWTRCYDTKTGVWHSRESFHQSTWRARHSVRAFGKTLVGDALSGKIYYLDKDTYTEASDNLIWTVVSPPLHVFPNGGILDAVHLDLATGYGTLTGDGADPKVMLQTSVDGGIEYTQYRELSIGTTGNYRARVTARRLGRFGPKGVVLKVSISDPVVRALVGVDVEVRPLKR